MTDKQLQDLYLKLDASDCEFNNANTLINTQRNLLLQSTQTISKKEYGAGSRILNNKQHSIKSMAQRGACSPLLGKILFNLTSIFNTQQVLEFGTQLGIGTAYIAASANTKNITSMEACPATLKVATDFFSKYKHGNKIETLLNTFDNSLEQLHATHKKFDLFYIDGDHRFSSLLRYFNYCKTYLATPNAIFVIDDINWSIGMFKAWKQMIQQTNALSFNAGRFGIIITQNMHIKGNFMLKFSKP